MYMKKLLCGFVCFFCLSVNSFAQHNTEDLFNLFYSLSNDITETPTAEEIAGFRKVKSLYFLSPSTPKETEATSARNFVSSLNISISAEGEMQGAELTVSSESMQQMTTYLSVLAALSLDETNNLRAQDQTLFNNYTDYLIYKKILSKDGTFRLLSNTYSDVRTIPVNVLKSIPACTSVQREKLMDFLRFNLQFGRLFDPDYLTHLNSDVMYNYLSNYLSYISQASSEKEGALLMKAFKRFMDRCTEYSPGTCDLLKPDGCGFHHHVHYNNYMQCYKFWVYILYNLINTPFLPDSSSFVRLKYAILSTYYMSVRSTNGTTQYIANTFCGRHPFTSGITVRFTDSAFKNLISLSKKILGSDDQELMAAYNYFYKSNNYKVASKKYDGFVSFNYAHAGVFRRDDWAVTMHAPTVYSWGTEIYDKTNRFGRYQSHGAVEVLYDGKIEDSGYPSLDQNGAGWDWCKPNGTTTTMSSWANLMPGIYTSLKLSQRFDQYALSKNFAGSVSNGSVGLFACDFDEGYAWGKTDCYKASGVVFKKSVFAFGNQLLCLGSNISSVAVTNNVTTNLFQQLTNVDSLLYNGRPLFYGEKVNIPANTSVRIMSPCRTGFYLPAVNDALSILLKDQTTPMSTGADYQNPTTTARAAKAFLNHGQNTSSKSYVYLTCPAVDDKQLKEIADDYEKGKLYHIFQQNEQLHAVMYVPEQIMGYAFFEPSSCDLSFGTILQSSVAQLIVAQEKDDVLKLTASDPSMNAIPDDELGFVERPTVCTLKVKGIWTSSSPEVSTVSYPDNDYTLVNYTLSLGKSLSITLQKEPTSLSSLISSTRTVESDQGCLVFRNLQNDDMISVYNIHGQMVYRSRTTQNMLRIALPVQTVYLCHIVGASGHDTVRVWNSKS